MIYEYECPVHKVIEVEQKIADPVLTECPLCRKEKNISSPVKKLISLCSFQLLGGKWSASGYS